MSRVKKIEQTKIILLALLPVSDAVKVTLQHIYFCQVMFSKSPTHKDLALKKGCHVNTIRSHISEAREERLLKPESMEINWSSAANKLKMGSIEDFESSVFHVYKTPVGVTSHPSNSERKVGDPIEPVCARTLVLYFMERFKAATGKTYMRLKDDEKMMFFVLRDLGLEDSIKCVDYFLTHRNRLSIDGPINIKSLCNNKYHVLDSIKASKNPNKRSKLYRERSKSPILVNKQDNRLNRIKKRLK